MSEGRIKRSGKEELIAQIEEGGFDTILEMS
jgi:Fe-S cluster assembly ATPase SufC